MMANIERLITPQELAEILGLKRSRIHIMLATGELPSIVVLKGASRRVFRVKPSELAKWLKAREVP